MPYYKFITKIFPSVFLRVEKKRGNKSLSRQHHFSNQTYFEGTKKKNSRIFYRSDLFSISFYSFIHNFACAIFLRVCDNHDTFYDRFRFISDEIGSSSFHQLFQVETLMFGCASFFSADGCIRWKTGRNCDEIARVTICYFIMMTMMVSSKCTSFSKLT